MSAIELERFVDRLDGRRSARGKREPEAFEGSARGERPARGLVAHAALDAAAKRRQLELESARPGSGIRQTVLHAKPLQLYDPLVEEISVADPPHQLRARRRIERSRVIARKPAAALHATDRLVLEDLDVQTHPEVAPATGTGGH